MQQLAKECLEIHDKLMPILKERQNKGDEISKLMKHDVISMLGDYYSEILVGAEFFEGCIYFIVIHEQDQLFIQPPSKSGGWFLDNSSYFDGKKMCKDKKLIEAFQSIVDKLNGKEVWDGNT